MKEIKIKQIKQKISKFNIINFIIILILPLVSFAGPGGGFIVNPINSGTIPIFLNSLLYKIIEIGAAVLAFYIVYTGFLFVSAQGNEQALRKAKDSLTWVLIGGAIILGATVLSEAIGTTMESL